MNATPQTAPSLTVFDRMQVRRQRARAAKHLAAHDALLREAAQALSDRVADVARKFERVLVLGDAAPFAPLFAPDAFVVTMDCAPARLPAEGLAVAADEEWLPFAPQSFDLIVSNLNLHWVNDLPGAFVQLRNALRPDGLFLASLLGGETLAELRQCLLQAELSVMGGVSPRLSPTVDLQTASGLLQRAGFALPVADRESYDLIYDDAFALMRDLRGMGEGNAHAQRPRRATRRGVFAEATRLYAQSFAAPAGGVSARFELLFLHGWKQ